jgi:PAS domain S-box-containing protein
MLSKPSDKKKNKTREYLVSENHSLKEYQEFLLSIIESSFDAIITINDEYNIEMINDTALNLFAYKKVELIGKSIDKLIPRKIENSKGERINNFSNSKVNTKYSQKNELIKGITSDNKIIQIENSISEFNIGGKTYFNVNIRSIENRVHMEEELRESENKFKDIFESLIDVFSRVNNDGVVVMISQSVTNLLGYTVEEMLGKKTIDFYVDSSDRNRIMNDVEKYGFCENFQTKIFTKKGDIKVVTMYVKPYTDASGNSLGIETVIRDITERHQMEQNIKLNTLLLQESQKIAHLGHFNWYLANGEMEWSDEFYRIHGVELNVNPDIEFTLSLVHQDDLNYVKENLDLAILQVKNYKIEYRIIRADNKEVVWVQANAQLKFDSDGNPISVLGTLIDITEKKNDEEALLQSEEEFRSIYEQTFIGIPLIDTQGRFLKTNKRFQEILGYTEREIKKMTLTDVTHPDDREKIKKSLKTLIEGNKSHIELENRYIKKTGEELICHTAITAPIGVHGRPTFLVASLTDITEQKRSQEILKGLSDIQSTFIAEANAKESFQKMLNALLKVSQSDSGFIVEVFSDKNNKSEFKELTSLNLPVNSASNNGDGEGIKNLSSLIDVILETGELLISNDSSSEPADENSNDNYVRINTFIGLPLFSNLEMIGIIGIANKSTGYYKEDVRLLEPFLATCSTLIKAYKNVIKKEKGQQESAKMKEAFTKELELKVAERTEDLEKTKKELSMSLEKEQELGALKSRFVATASHQFRTPLTVIQSSMGVLSMQKDLMDEKLKPSFEKAYNQIRSQIGRMTSLMNDVLILGKINAGNVKPVFESVNLVPLCQEIIDNHNQIQEDSRKMDLEVQGKSYNLDLDSSLISHAISNFVSNAFKYSVGQAEPKMIISFKKQSLTISVKDSGLGIPSKDLEQLFEPFYRASNVSDLIGTGLGTSIAKEYIELNHGEIEVISELNKGSEFILKFNK